MRTAAARFILRRQIMIGLQIALTSLVLFVLAFAVKSSLENYEPKTVEEIDGAVALARVAYSLAGYSFLGIFAGLIVSILEVL